MADRSTYSAEQLAVAARELRQAAGADEERFSTAEALSMLREELRLLRERGFTSTQIADLLTGFDICVTPEEVQQHGPPARFTD